MARYLLALCAILSSYVLSASQNHLLGTNIPPCARFTYQEYESDKCSMQPNEMRVHKKIMINVFGQCARLYYTVPLSGAGPHARPIPIIAQLEENHASHDPQKVAQFVQQVGGMAHVLQNYMKKNLPAEQNQLQSK